MIDNSTFQNYVLSVTSMDEQHWNLIQMLIDVSKCSDVTLALKKMDAFIAEWRAHLADEEDLMEVVCFPYRAAHRSMHETLLIDYDKLRESTFRKQDRPDSIQNYAKRAQQLILHHIDNYDRQYGDWIKAH